MYNLLQKTLLFLILVKNMCKTFLILVAIMVNFKNNFYTYQGRNLFFNGRLIFHILDVENEPRKTSVPSYVE